MPYYHDKLSEFESKNEFFIALDSDGCVFDTMEIKHKECFCPAFIKHFELQAVSRFAREVWEFVNLYSISRGCNRFKALTASLDLLGKRKETSERDVCVPRMERLRSWISSENRLGNNNLKQMINSQPHPELTRALEWSEEVNKTIAGMIRNIPPFPYARKSLQIMQGRADPIVCSQTPTETLEREWRGNNIASLVSLINGQEMGTKAEQIEYTGKGRYPTEKMLMIGDAPGDLQAVRDNGIRFYPINPGHENDSWHRFANETLELFLAGKYTEAYEQKLIAEFKALLPHTPPWQSESKNFKTQTSD